MNVFKSNDNKIVSNCHLAYNMNLSSNSNNLQKDVDLNITEWTWTNLRCWVSLKSIWLSNKRYFTNSEWLEQFRLDDYQMIKLWTTTF